MRVVLQTLEVAQKQVVGGSLNEVVNSAVVSNVEVRSNVVEVHQHREGMVILPGLVAEGDERRRLKTGTYGSIWSSI